MDGGFELADHGGDLRLRAWGGSREAAACQLLRALWTAVFGPAPVPAPRRWEVWRAPADLPPAMALVELASDALSRLAVAGEAAVGFRGGLESGELGLAGIPGGLEPQREVKAVTYHKPILEPAPGVGWLAEVTVDL